MIGIPNELKEFAQWLNPENLRAFNKLEVLQLGLKVAQTQAPLINAGALKKLSQGLVQDEQSLGTFVLRLYFYQLFHLPIFSLDLRRARFHYTDSWHYSGQKLGHEFSAPFIQGLQNIYKAYYLDQGRGMKESLAQLNLFSDHWSEEQKMELLSLFNAHFSAGSQGPMTFNISEMIKSFGKIFFFIRNHGGKVPSEFALLGIYLASLYLTLQETRQAFNVKDAFDFAFQN